MTLDEFLLQVRDVREYKRGQAVKLDLSGYARELTAAVLSVSVNFVSKWRLQYDAAGVEGLRLSYRGSAGYLDKERRQQVLDWINGQPEPVSRRQLETYLADRHQVRYKSTRSYYALLQAARAARPKHSPGSTRPDPDLQEPGKK